MKEIITLAILAFACTGCSYIDRAFGYEDDNIIEEAAESVIKYKTGIDIDFTPSSPEIKSVG